MLEENLNWIKKLEEQQRYPCASVFSWVWHLLLLGICGVVAYVGSDWLSLYLASNGLSFLLRFLIIALYANLPLFYFFYFSSWSSREAIHKTAKVITQQDIGVFESIKRYAIERYKKLEQQLNHNKVGRVIKWIVRVVRGGNVYFIFFLSIWPIAGWKSWASFFFGATKARNSMIALIIGNTIKTAYMIEAWRILYGIFGESLKFAVYFSIAGIVVFLLIKVLFRKMFPKPCNKSS